MRKLAISCGAFSAVITVACYLDIDRYRCLMIAAACFIAAFFLFSRKSKVERIVYFAAVGVFFGIINYSVQSYFTKGAAEKLNGTSNTVCVRILSMPKSYDAYSFARVKIIEGNAPKLNAVLYDYTGSISEYEIGDAVYVNALFSQADIRYGQDYDHYNSKDIYFKLTVKQPVALSRKAGVLKCLPQRINYILGNRVDYLFDEDISPFMKSLLLGDRSELNNDTAVSTALSRSGFSHVVAVSGMHIAFLIAISKFLFGETKSGCVVSILIIWLFAVMTGASPSVVRAAIMQTFALSSVLLVRENDLPTALLTALALILLINPFAAQSISLQLSFGAMAGIALFGDGIYSFLLSLLPKERHYKPITYVFGIIASSVSVLIFVIPLSAIHFGYIPLLSVLTNIAALWSVSLCFGLGWFCCIFGRVRIIGELAVRLCSLLVKYIYAVISFVSSIPYSVLYVETKGAWLWLAVTVIIILLMFFLNFRTYLKIGVTIVVSLAVLAVVFTASDHEYRYGPASFAVIDVGQGQSIAALSGDCTVMIDCGNVFSSDNAGDKAAEYLYSRGRDKVDVLMLTHYHSDHINGIETLLELIPVDTILIPDFSSYDPSAVDVITASARRHNTEVRKITADTDVSAEDIVIHIFTPPAGEEEEDKSLTALMEIRGHRVFVSGDSSGEAELGIMRKHGISDVDTLVVAHHGSRYSSFDHFLRNLGADCGIISTGYNTYGHPHEETLERLYAAGYNVLRTDLTGTVELRIGY